MSPTLQFLDDPTRSHVIGEMSALHFDDAFDALRRMSYLVPSGKRFSKADVVAVFEAIGVSTDRVHAILSDLARRRILESYPKDGTVIYYLERGARLDYAALLKRTNGGAPSNPGPARSDAEKVTLPQLSDPQEAPGGHGGISVC